MLFKINNNKYINHAISIKHRIADKNFDKKNINKLYFSIFKDFRSMIGEYINVYKNELSKKELTRVRELWERLGHPNFENIIWKKAYYTLINTFIKEDFASVCWYMFCIYATNKNSYYEFKAKKYYYEGSYEPTIIFSSEFSDKYTAVAAYNKHKNNLDKINPTTVYFDAVKFVFENFIAESNIIIKFK
jgi:hypothetical protein